MPIEDHTLGYDATALEPHVSAQTVALHHGKRLQAHIDAVNQLIDGTELADRSLDTLVRVAQGRLFEHAAQAWNIRLYWDSLKPVAAGGGGQPPDVLLHAIEASFDSFETFRERFRQLATRGFGNGWVWLLQRTDGRLDLSVTPHVLTPLTGPDVPLLACSLWEHAYVLDYQDDRGKYLEAFWQVVDWNAVAARVQSYD